MGRSSRDVVTMCGPLVDELASGTLGDQRLNERRNRLLAVLERHPDAGFPEVCVDDAEVEALYRFLRNRRVVPAAILAPHLQATHERCAAIGEALVIHDTTDMVFAGEGTRRGLTRLGPGRQGFWLHAAFAVSTDGLRAPLGVLNLLPFVRRPRAPGTTKDDRERFADPAKESRGWGESVAQVRQRFGTETTAIHIMDRAGDSYELFSDLVAHHDRFIVRLTHDRRVVTAEGGDGALHDALPHRDARCERDVVLAVRRNGHRTLSSRTFHPAREQRVATLRMAAQRVEVQRPALVRPPHPATLVVHIVYVWEVNAPADADPVEWRLMTTEPIDTVEQIVQIVDWYRTRWLIEEFFKALKTGCAYEKRQLESYQTLLVALALLAPIAWRLLLLRHLARALPAPAATVALSPRQLQVLRACRAGATLPLVPTVAEALRVVARLGGHLRQNGPPGWLVLARGLQTLLTMELGWSAAQRSQVGSRCDQS
jgi:Transposase DNA-binding/Transposase DDE domain